MSRSVLILFLIVTLAACGRSSDEPTTMPTLVPSSSTLVPPPTVTPAAPPTSKPTPTPLSLEDVGAEFRTFVNEAHAYAIQVPITWQIGPQGASQADRVELAAPGPEQFRGANTLPPLVMVITALGAEASYTRIDDVAANHSLGGEVLDTFDLEINGLPARRVLSIDPVYGRSFQYIIQRETQFFLVDVYGYDQPPSEPVLNTFVPLPGLTKETIAGQIQSFDVETQTMAVRDEAGVDRGVVWFSDTEILPKGRLNGHIDPGDFVEVVGIVFEEETIQATRMTLQVPTLNDALAVLEFQRMGGIAGFMDRLVIFDGGLATLQQGEGPAVQKQLSAEQWKQVKNYASIFRPFAWHQEDNPGGPDNMILDLDFYGSGKFDTVLANEEEIAGYIHEILATLASS